MMKLDTSNRRDWQGFTRILEVMTFLDEIENHSKEEVREAVDGFCDLPTNPGNTMSMEEVVFWAGVATGIEYSRHSDEDTVDPITAEKMLVFSSIFAHSVKNAVVDLAICDLEAKGFEKQNKNQEPLPKMNTRLGR